MNTIEKQISATVARIIKEHFCKGPLKIETTICKNFILVHATGHTLTFESELAQTETGCQKVRDSRLKWFDYRREALMETISELIGTKVDKLFYDFNPKIGEDVMVAYLQNN